MIFHPLLPKQAGERRRWKNLHGASASLILAEIAALAKQPILIIAPDSLRAANLLEELNFFKSYDTTLLSFPSWETLPYDHFSPHQDIISERLTALSRIPRLQQGAIITTIATLMHVLPPQTYLDTQSFVLKIGDTLNLSALSKRLDSAGYHHVSQVREHGEFAVRGSIIDLFPMGSFTPFRIDLLDDEVDSIRTFSPETQRTMEKQSTISLLPAKEFPLTDDAVEHFRKAWRAQFSGQPLKCPLYQDVSEKIYSAGIEYYLPLFFSETKTLFDYLPANTLIITLENIEEKAQEFWQEINLRYEQGRFDVTRPLCPPQQIFLPPEKINAFVKRYPRVNILGPHPNGNASHIADNKDQAQFDVFPAPMLPIDYKASKPLGQLQAFMAQNQGRVLFCAESLGRKEALLQLFHGIGLSPEFFPSWQAYIESDKPLGLVIAPLEEGFCLTEPPLTVFSESHFYGKRVMQRRLRKKSAQDTDALIRDLTELQIGDAVVHIQHGIGRYQGLQTLRVGDEPGEFLLLEYQNQDKLYVPVSHLHLINRYSGANPDQAPINKLGSEQWQRAKRKAEEKIRDVAAELLDIQAQRAARSGYVYTIEPDAYAAFCQAFPFEETPDQLQACEQIMADMKADTLMDRVVCGDVGFGKTEVAMRAAFIAVQNNKQVAVLVPTTLLAQQHLKNFQDRFADWPVHIDMLSRFRTGKEQKNILEKIAEGKVDIVIGTHKLLQSDVQFKSLGLIIVDEEHRFGVKQKEKLKSLRALADLLTLTATPIPRTLNMALAGLRGLSIIATPPARRLSVKTFVHEYQNNIVQEALQREILRGGQVYFLHNDIATIQQKAEEIARLGKEIRLAVAHGQMHERELEKIMSEFYHRHYNVLICSTIVESGIDVPSANTIIINRADKFGLAQLHQLRGRVGRSHHQAYAYLLTPPKNNLKADAVKRLDAIAALDELGMGFTLATHDLEIRGAGELLGEEQSGHIHEIGFTLYMDLLSRAVQALKEGKTPDFTRSTEQIAEIDMHLPALIPDNYLPDVQIRLQFYKRLANAKNQAELDDIQVEMIDRFGLLPDPLKTLVAVTELKLKAGELGIIKIEAHQKSVRFEFTEKPQVKLETIIRLIQTKPQQFRLEGPSRLRVMLADHEPKERVQLIEQIVGMLA